MATVCTKGQKNKWNVLKSTKVAYNIARLTVRLLLHGVEGLATQLGAAGHAHKAVDVEDLIHGGAAGAFSDHVLPTAGTSPWEHEEEEDSVKKKKKIHIYFKSDKIYQQSNSCFSIFKNTAKTPCRHFFYYYEGGL